MTSLKIKIDKEILYKSRMCSTDHSDTSRSGIGANCAVSLAIISIFPDAWVFSDHIRPFYFSKEEHKSIYNGSIPLPREARDFISSFDAKSPEERMQMEELEFSIDIPDSVLETINIEEIKPLLINHPTLELIEN